ncbi:MAG: NAD(P)H-dependent oxidoreductase [Hyphomicrobiaceae bacterium]|nr:MAG: NAD(P)H-dependent oxidoreductase [Hyphomicrobiaceae bacterium]
MAQRITIIQGHPDPSGNRFCHALADAYAAGAAAAGIAVRRIEVGALAFPVLRTQLDFETGAPPPAIAEAQEAIRWADHLVIIYPLWLGTMPALLKAFFEQAFRPGFALGRGAELAWASPLKGRSARIVVTMGMPAFFYRWYFGAHGLKSLERSILRFAGIKPFRETLIGMIGTFSEAKAKAWLAKLEALGRSGS